MAHETKSKMLSMRVTDKQFQYLDELAKRIKKQTGFHITRASIMLKLMEYGLPFLEKDFPKLRTMREEFKDMDWDPIDRKSK